MAVAKVMSWNIKTLGEKKAQVGPKNAPLPSELISFICGAIGKSQADVVGITEIRSELGAQISGWLCARLNAALPMGAAYRWRAVVSAQQDGGTKEEYIVLWTDQAGALSLNTAAVPSAAWLMGVVDDNSLNSFFASVGWTTAAQKTQAYAALAADKYIYNGAFGKGEKTTTWRVVPDQWQALRAMVTPEVKFTSATKKPPTMPTQAQRQDLAARLLAIDMLRFVSFGDRSPFVVNFLLGSTNEKVTYAVMHAPGSSDSNRFPAANVFGLSAPLANASATDALLIAGDFNIAVKYMSERSKKYDRISKNGKFTFAEDSTSVPQQVFAPVVGAPLNATDLIPGQLTSISERFIPDGSNFQDALANAYDKMFFHSGSTVYQAIPRVINPMRWLASNQGVQVFDPAAAASAMAFLRAYKGNTPFAAAVIECQNAVTKANKKVATLKKQIATAAARVAKVNPPANSSLRKRLVVLGGRLNKAQIAQTNAVNDLANVTVVAALANNAVNVACTGIGTALAVYRRVISDHLPVIVNVSV